VPRNLKLVTVSIFSPFMKRKVWSCLCFLKYMISPFVLWTFRTRLFAEHQRESFSTSALYAVSSPSEMSPTTVVLSAYFMMVLVGWVGVQLYYRAYSRGLSAQPWWKSVLSMIVEVKWGPSLTNCWHCVKSSLVVNQMLCR